MKILHNRNLDELTDKTDLLGLGNKSKAIQFFIENLIDDNNIQMIALYGDWGSGKTSIMKDLEKNLTTSKTNNFHSIFFEVWKHEKDENIALSLLSSLTDDIVGDSVVKETFDNAIDLFKSFGSGISFDFSIGDIFGANKAGVKISPKDIMNSYKELQKERYNKSYFTIQKHFIEQIGLIEHEILVKQNLDPNKGKIVVFLDDLDRCEPEVVLDLLASIKLFYTYGKRLIFVCGVDKIAVQNAVKTKYNEIIKSEEYLEKIFDASFQVPTAQSYEKLLHYYFGDIKVSGKPVVQELSKFFKSIHFYRPRHLKKILNKYATLIEFKNATNTPIELKKIIPNIIDEKGNGIYFETFVTLYFIILSEFHPILYNNVKDLNTKIILITKVYHDSINNKDIQKVPYSSSLNHIETNLFGNNFHIKNLNETKTIIKTINTKQNLQATQRNRIKNEFFTLFLPGNGLRSIDLASPPPTVLFIKQFSEVNNDFSIDFCQYLLSNYDEFLKDDWSDYNFQNFFKMIQDLL